MLFDVLLGRLLRRLEEFERTRRADLILNEDGQAEAAQLWDTAQPADLDSPTAQESSRYVAARQALGYLCYLRSTRMPAELRLSELAQALLLLAPFTANVETAPEPMRRLLGPRADTVLQASTAADLLTDTLSTGNFASIEASILLLNEVLPVVTDQVVRDSALMNLGIAFQMRFDHTGDMDDLQRAIDADRLALADIVDGATRAATLSNLGLAYESLFARTKDPADLDRAIDTGEQALRAGPEHPSRGPWLVNLAGAYRTRFSRSADTEDLHRVMELAAEAVAITPEKHPNFGGILSVLYDAHQTTLNHSGDLKDIDRAIDIGERVTRTELADERALAELLSGLGRAYQTRYHRSNMLTDLTRAIEVGNRSVRLTPPNEREYATRLANLVSAYWFRYNRAGAMDDLETAIRLGEQVLGRLSDGPTRTATLMNLAIAYSNRHQHHGVLVDLDQAISLLEEALRHAADDDDLRGRILTNLGTSYHARFDHVRDVTDLTRAIDMGEKSLESWRGPVHRGGMLANLGGHYLARHQRTEDPGDLDRGVSLCKQAVLATPQGEPEIGYRLQTLATAFWARFNARGDAMDLTRAIRHSERALFATPQDHPERVVRTQTLARLYRIRIDNDGRGVTTDRFGRLNHEVTQSVAASPVRRVEATTAVGSLAHAMNRPADAVRLLDAAVALLPTVAPRESGWDDQEQRLGEHLGLVSEAVAAHLSVDDAVGAVQIAELGRGILLGGQLDARTDLTELARAAPEQAAQLRELRTDLARDHPAERRRGLWDEYDDLVTRIRRLPGFDRFQLPPRLDDLRPILGQDTVVLVNASESRGDAIIITSDADPVVVRLPDLDIGDVRAQAVALLDATHDRRAITGALRRQRVLSALLGWLWDAIADPIIDVLAAQSSLPRVWWMPTGHLGLFPLHAAGHLGRPGALDSLVSSYTPTLRALAYARERPPATSRRQLAVSLSRTPGAPDLPGATAEAAALMSNHHSSTLIADNEATSARVLEVLADSTWAHFACHAYADLSAPSRGGIRLYDRTLPITDISRLRLDHGELAYLSACSTAYRGWRHAEESLHLASAFQLAGFRHVIASLWPLDDEHAATTARDFYARLPQTPTADHAAATLHTVTKNLRTQLPNRPDLWTSLIHSGA